jgi:fatty acid kinase fatty acid binding subunit
VTLTAENTAIVLDSTADFPDAAERFPNWRVVPLYVTFGDASYRDGVDMPAGEFYERLRAAPALPTTSQPAPADFLAAYEELAAYERIFSIHLAAQLSGTLGSAGHAAVELARVEGRLGHAASAPHGSASQAKPGGRVRTIDSGVASAAITMLALAVQRRLERGTSDGEIDALVERFHRERGLLFTVDTLEFLARGGRIGRARAFAGELMHVKPILTISDGEVVPVTRVRGNRKAFQAFVDALESGTRDEPGLRVGIAHAAAPERAEEIAKLVRDRRPHAEIEAVTGLGAVLGAHAGPGTVGFFWFSDDS